MYPNKAVFIDIETTGTSVQYDHPTGLAAVVMEDGEIVGDPFVTPIAPPTRHHRISVGALEVQCGSITSEAGAAAAIRLMRDLMGAPGAASASRKFCEWCKTIGGTELAGVAHNLTFDMGFAGKLRHDGNSLIWREPPLSGIWIDTMDMARLAWPGRSAHTIDDCLMYCGLTGRNSKHNPLEDAVSCGYVYFMARDRILNGETE